MASEIVGSADGPEYGPGATGLPDDSFALVAHQLAEQRYAIVDAALPAALFSQLHNRAQQQAYRPAQIGRAVPKVALATRSDEIAWVSASDAIDATWVRWLDSTQRRFNRQLFLGLRSAESHYAHYAPGTRYRRHRDAFRSVHLNRVVSLVLYLNASWSTSSGGELLLYDNDGQQVLARVSPMPNRLVVFLSAEVPHEVLPATQDRYSLAAWFRS